MHFFPKQLKIRHTRICSRTHKTTTTTTHNKTREIRRFIKVLLKKINNNLLFLANIVTIKK